MVVRTKDTKATAWIGTIGHFLLGSDTNRITKDPYEGELFRSANGLTWIPQGGSDLTFRLNRALFNTADSSTAQIEVTPYSGTENIITNKIYNLLRYNVPTIIPSDTSLSTTTSRLWNDSTIDTKFINLNETQTLNKPYYLIDTRNSTTTTLSTTLLNTDEIDQTKPYNIIYDQNSVISGTDYINSSLYFNVDMSTTVDNVSPVIDIQKMSVTLIKNIINYLTGDEVELEKNPTGGKALARYITKPVKLAAATPANKLFVSFSASLPENNNCRIDIFYKVYNSLKNADQIFIQKGWTFLDSAVTTSSGFIDFEYQTNPLVYEGNSKITEFDWFSVKLVLQSNNSSDIPKIKDLRIIALTA